MSTLVASLATKRAAIIAITLLIAAAVGVTVLNDRGMFGRPASNGDVASALRKTVETGVNGMQAIGDSVASLFDSRSPGERAAGLLANMKQRRAPALHQRALPKVRGPVNPLAGIVGAAPTPPALEAPVVAQPLEKVVNGAPTGPVAISPPGGVAGGPGGGGFPGVFVPGGGGGGGVFVPPPAINPPETPPVTPPVVIPPTTSGVPEPSTWVTMLLGFLLMGGAIRRPRRAALA